MTTTTQTIAGTQVTFEGLKAIVGFDVAMGLACFTPPMAQRKALNGNTVHILPGTLSATWIVSGMKIVSECA